MTTPLQRYNVDTVFEPTWNNDGWEECLQIEESDNGDWVRYSEVRDEIEKLEKQNQMMLDALKELCNGKWGCPCELSNEELAAWDKARTSITNVEGQNNENRQTNTNVKISRTSKRDHKSPTSLSISRSKRYSSCAGNELT